MLARARFQVLQNSASRMVVLRFTTCQREIVTDEIQERKNYRQRSNIKSAPVNALTGSVPRKKALVQQCVSELIRNQTQVTKLNYSP